MSRYCYSHNEETFHGDFATERQAARDAFYEDDDLQEVWVGERVDPPSPESCIDADLLIESVQNQEEYSNEYGEDWGRCSKHAKEELTNLIQPVFAAWIKDNGMTPTFFNVRHETVRRWTREEVLNG